MGKKSSAPSPAFVFLLLLVCTLLASCCRPAPSRSPTTARSARRAGRSIPSGRRDVRMAAETVQSTCFGRFAEYRVDFRFVNEGATQKVKLGFPFTDTVAGERGTERPFGFQAWQDGRASARARGTGAIRGADVDGGLLRPPRRLPARSDDDHGELPRAELRDGHGSPSRGRAR